jgi:hypothetical protein
VLFETAELDNQNKYIFQNPNLDRERKISEQNKNIRKCLQEKIKEIGSWCSWNAGPSVIKFFASNFYAFEELLSARTSTTEVDLSVLKNYSHPSLQHNEKPSQAIPCLGVLLRTGFKPLTVAGRAVAAGKGWALRDPSWSSNKQEVHILSCRSDNQLLSYDYWRAQTEVKGFGINVGNNFQIVDSPAEEYRTAKNS